MPRQSTQTIKTETIMEQPSADHDLLIEVNTNVKNLTTSLHAYIANINGQIGDHETRIRTVEAANQVLIGGQRTQKNFLVVVSTVTTIALAVLGVLQLVKH